MVANQARMDTCGNGVAMKKIPTLFKRIFENNRIVGITDEVTEGMEWVLNGEGIATVKWDGSCCAIIGGELYKRYDAKKGKKPPEGAIPCCDPDPITGHHPHWVKCDRNNPADKWFFNALDRTDQAKIQNDNYRTYEAVGKHFNGNPYGWSDDILISHGDIEINRNLTMTFDGIKKFLKENYIEGIVFWLNGEPMCKIKRSDFGFEWGKGQC